MDPQPFRKQSKKPIRKDRLFWYNKLIGREFQKDFQKHFRFESFGVWKFQKSSTFFVEINPKVQKRRAVFRSLFLC